MTLEALLAQIGFETYFFTHTFEEKNAKMFNISFVVYCFYDILMYFFVILTYVFHFFHLFHECKQFHYRA